MLKEGQLLCRSDYEKEREMLSAISPAPTESGERGVTMGDLLSRVKRMILNMRREALLTILYPIASSQVFKATETQPCMDK